MRNGLKGKIEEELGENEYEFRRERERSSKSDLGSEKTGREPINIHKMYRF